uniref:Uncharacterized protein n=1 Tax=Populus trichocarpa TaxID=3694 RepID=A0A2K1Z982_POPTR
MRTTPAWQRNRKTSQLNQNGVNEPDGGADGFLTAHVLQGTWLCRRQVTLHQAFEPTTTRVGDEKANLRKISMDLMVNQCAPSLPKRIKSSAILRAAFVRATRGGLHRSRGSSTGTILSVHP